MSAGPSTPCPRSSSMSNPRISRLFTTVLGSPFLLPEEVVDVPPPLSLDRSPSPTPTADYSFISRTTEYPNRWSMQQSPLRAFLPRLWDVLSTPTKNLLTVGPDDWDNYTPSPKKDKLRTPYSANFTSRSPEELRPVSDEHNGWELIDDEACFIDLHAVTGFDIIAQLPQELSLAILCYLFSPSAPLSSSTNFSRGSSEITADDAMRALFTCLGVSRTWRRLASDNSVWKTAFLSRWVIDESRVEAFGPPLPRWSKTLSPHPMDSPAKQTGSFSRVRRLALSRSDSFSSLRRASSPSPVTSRPSTPCTPITPSSAFGPLNFDWKSLYQQRFQLERRWMNKSFEPKVTRIEGHTDSVYCLEYDEASSLIITGSRDRTIKVWSLRSGRPLGTFAGVHKGSVLCLKFEMESGSSPHESPVEYFSHSTPRQIFMVSGSSDTTVSVWDLTIFPATSGYDRAPRTLKGDVRTTLRGHAGGVLDIRLDKRWIVSCSKDGMIRVWDRNTLESVRTLVGHEGPVNAVGLQSSTGRVVSASGDNKMILWDIETGARLKTFEGHDRGLACIEFKGDLIVSGSNDCKIKVWSANGECLRTLVGHEALVRALSYDPTTGLLVSASYDRMIKVWDLRTGKMVREFKGSHSSHIFDVKFDCRRIVSTSHDQHLVIHDFSSGLPAAPFFV